MTAPEPSVLLDLAELEQLEVEIDVLGREINKKRERALEIMKDRIATVRGKRFLIQSARAHFSGMGGVRIFYEGPQLKQDGSPHARNRESAPSGMMDKIEAARSTDTGGK
jgi:hypothetical protein